MAQVFVGSLMLVPYNFAPLGYAICSGQLLPIGSNTALFSLLGTQFGGDGKTTFGLPNLNGSHAIGQGSGPGLSPYFMGETGGSQTVTLLTGEVPQHNHSVMGGKSPGDANAPVGKVLAVSNSPVIYTNVTNSPAVMNGQSTNFVGSSLPHNNMMPYQGLQWIIALQGIYPTRG
jgi:microcystin-dependent protein